MTILSGRLQDQDVERFDAYRVVATFEEAVKLGDPEAEPQFVPSRRETVAAADGSFRLELPDAEERRGAIALVAATPDGLAAGTASVPADGPFDDLAIAVTTPVVTQVPTSPDITLGERIKYSGRVIDPAGRGAPADLLVVIWARRADGDDAAPVSVARTSAGGYFSAPWPSDRFTEAFAVVSGGEPLPVAVEDERLPQRIILVLPELPAAEEHDDDCACVDAPPRGQDSADVAANAEAFAADRGRCVDFTVPDRTVDEVTYQAVVRTTQPEVKGTRPRKPPIFPPRILERLAELAQLRPAIVGGADQPEPTEPSLPRGERPLPTTGIAGDAVRVARTFMPGIDLDGGWIAGPGDAEHTAQRVLEARTAAGQPLRLEASVLAELARETGELTATRLVEAEHTSVVRHFRDSVGLLGLPRPGRFELQPELQLDWEGFPDAYQATTIAHGHLLTLKQVWRADGYSLGDLLYSLPLAPGQQKLVSVLDWNRSEVASRRASREVSERLDADLSHDRDISDIIRTTLTERLDARSHADVAAGGGGIGGFIGPFVFGAAGGVSSAGSTASQTSARGVTGLALNRVRDRTLQSASAVRNQRSSVVQTARQSESVRAMTEVVANYSHCHAMTVEYFEVLRHLQVSQALAAVQECLFIPFAVTPFNVDKALRWRAPLREALRSAAMREAFDALERVRSGWEGADVPVGRYADEPLTYLDGELQVRALLPRPADDDDDGFVAANWGPYAEHLWTDPASIWNRYLGVALPRDRDAIWDSRIAPGIAQRLLDRVELTLITPSGATQDVELDAALVSRFAQNRSLLVGLNTATTLPAITRSQIQRVRLNLAIATPLPANAELIVDSGTLSYRTAHLVYQLFRNRRILNDLTLGDDVEIATPLSLLEKRDPRAKDRKDADRLLDHLNERAERLHAWLLRTMHPNRLALLLDGFVAPDAGGRSVASVVENRIIGVVGNSLVMPVAPGQKLDATYEYGESTPEDLRHLYAGDSAPPMRISVPTSGVFAEAVLGNCNSCEVIDDTRFWRFEDAPIPDRPPTIEALSTASRRRTPPSLAPDALPTGVVGLQQTPRAPDPTGLAAAVAALGTANIFKDLTGLALNQSNASEAFAASVKAAQGFATQAGALAQQKFLNGELDRSLDHIKKARDKGLLTKDEARDLTESTLRGALGEPRPAAQSPAKSESVKRAIERVATAKKGSLRVTRPEGTVEVKSGQAAGRPAIDVAVDPAVIPIRQKSRNVCWAAAATIMESWRTQSSITPEALLDGLGGDWRAKYDRDEALTIADFRAFVARLVMVEDGPVSYTPDGLARLLASKGPLLEIGDDAVENNLLVHARIITAIRGDGTPAGTEVTLADPDSGTIQPPEPFEQFDRRHGGADAVKFGVGIIHY